MGILSFYGSVLNASKTSAISPNYSKIISGSNHLMIDFNSIIHVECVRYVECMNNVMKSALSFMYINDSKKRGITTGEPPIYSMDQITSLERTYKMNGLVDAIHNGDDPMNIINIFSNTFTGEFLDAAICGIVIDTVVELAKKYMDPNTFKTLMIAVDGVPSKGKMLEQRKRRYMGGVISGYSKILLEKHKDDLVKRPYYIYLAHKHAISWNRNKITPGTEFMELLSRHLEGGLLRKKMYELYGRDIAIEISGYHQVGEGEKKIVNYIEKYHHDSEDKIIFYSPDSDVVLLSMLLSTPNVHVLRLNQQKSKDDNIYDLVHIRELKKSFNKYVAERIGHKADMTRVNNDMVFIMTLFGDDFIAHIESLNLSSDFDIFIEAYAGAISENISNGKIRYLLRESGGKVVPSLTILKSVLRELLPLEQDFIDDNIGYQMYINYGEIKRLVSRYQKVDHKNITGLIKQISKKYYAFTDQIKSRPTREIIKNYSLEMDLVSTIQHVLGSVVLRGKTCYLPNLNAGEFIDFLRDYFKNSKGTFPNISRKLRLKEPIRNITNPGLGYLNHRTLNPYELEYAQFDKVIDGYEITMNKQSIDLTKSNVSGYYKEYFGFKQKYNGNLSEEAMQVMEHYVQGMMWVFNYYYNDPTYINTWYYKYEKSPLLKHVLEYLELIDTSAFRSILDSLDGYKVDDLDDYFNPVEQLIYASPLTKSTISLFPPSYRQYFLEFAGLADTRGNGNFPKFMIDNFLDITMIINSIEIGKPSEYVDCKGVRYLNKCHIKPLPIPTTRYDRKFVRNIRKLKTDKISKIRSAVYFPKY